MENLRGEFREGGKSGGLKAQSAHKGLLVRGGQLRGNERGKKKRGKVVLAIASHGNICIHDACGRVILQRRTQYSSKEYPVITKKKQGQKEGANRANPITCLIAAGRPFSLTGGKSIISLEGRGWVCKK